MKIETVAISAIHPYAGNAKKHPQSQIEQIKASIQQFGNNDPIAIDEDGVVLEGHGRFKALQQLGYKTVEVIRLDGLTEDQKRAYILIHNQLTMNTGFDPDKLREEIEAIQTVDLTTYDLAIDTTLDPAPPQDMQVKTHDAQPVNLEKFSLVLAEEQYQQLVTAMDMVRSSGAALHSFGNPNKRVNLIFEVVYRWAEQKRLL